MDYSKIGLFNAIQQKMRFVGQRQSVLAENIANANVPRYQAKDLKPVEFDQLVTGASNKIQLAATNSGHITSSSGGKFKSNAEKPTFETTPVGNTVVLEEQALKMAENNVDYQATTGVYRKMIDLFRLATSGNK